MIFIFLIVASFLVTGYGTLQGTPDTVINVGGVPVKIVEYQREFKRQKEFYKRIFGGKDLTTAQIEQFKIKDATIRNLVQRKLLVKIADDIGVFPSNNQIKEEIKDLPYFLTGGAFDIDKYKQLLASNGYTPKDFEGKFRQDLKTQLAAEVLENYPSSDAYFTELKRFKDQAIEANLGVVKKVALRNFIKIKNSEVKKFLANSEDKARVKDLFIDKKSSLDQTAKIKASHILFKIGPNTDAKKIEAQAKKVRASLTKANFARKANKLTEDPSGKGKGGSLDWFEKGRMVPEFEAVAFKMKIGEISKPIKSAFGYHIIYLTGKKKAISAVLAKYERDLAKELIRASKTKEHKALVESVTKQLAQALKSNSSRSLDALSKKYKEAVAIQKKVNVNRLEGGSGEASKISPENIDSLFVTPSKKSYRWDEASTVTVLEILNTTPTVIAQTDAEKKQERRTNKQAWGKKFSKEALKNLEDDIDVTVNNKLLRL